MNYFFIFTILIILNITIAATASSSNSLGVVIWNGDDVSVNIGTVDYSNPGSEATVMLTIDSFTFTGDALTQSTYNYATNKLTFVGTQPYSVQGYLITVDCITWKVVGKVFLPVGYTFSGLAYDQSKTDHNIFTTFYQGNNRLQIIKINPYTQDMKFLDTLDGVYQAAAYNFNTKQYYLSFTNNTGLFMKSYFSPPNKVVEVKQIGFIGSSPPILISQYNLMFNPYQKSLMGMFQLSNYDSQVINGLGFLSWETGFFNMTEMMGLDADTFITTVPDMNGGTLIYTFCFTTNPSSSTESSSSDSPSLVNLDGGIFIQTWNSTSCELLSTVPFKTAVLSAF